MTSPNRLEFFARAAMFGLLAASQTACSDEAGDESDQGETGGESNGSGGESASGGNSPSGGGSNSGGSATGGLGGDTSASGGQGGDSGATGILSSEVIPDLTLEEFEEDCEEAGGVVETHAVCGGANSCKGFSYDSDTDVFTVHTCRGYNTCRGFSCVVPE